MLCIMGYAGSDIALAGQFLCISGKGFFMNVLWDVKKFTTKFV